MLRLEDACCAQSAQKLQLAPVDVDSGYSLRRSVPGRTWSSFTLTQLCHHAVCHGNSLDRRTAHNVIRWFGYMRIQDYAFKDRGILPACQVAQRSEQIPVAQMACSVTSCTCMQHRLNAEADGDLGVTQLTLRICHLNVAFVWCSVVMRDSPTTARLRIRNPCTPSCDFAARHSAQRVPEFGPFPVGASSFIECVMAKQVFMEHGLLQG